MNLVLCCNISKGNNFVALGRFRLGRVDVGKGKRVSQWVRETECNHGFG